MKRLKRAFAMLLCIAMVMSLCMTFSSAAEVLYYDSLDDIPENKDIFLALRTGTQSTFDIFGYYGVTRYYQFSNANYIIRIAETAFTLKPRNAYLDDDNKNLSLGCMTNGKAERTCYYTTRAKTSDGYSYSRYRLELTADTTHKDGEIAVTAKLTSGITFNYDSARHTLERTQKSPLRPNISVAVTNDSQDVHFVGYTVKGYTPYCDAVSAIDAVTTSASAIACAESVQRLATTSTSKGKLFLNAGIALATCATVLIPVGKEVYSCVADHEYSIPYEECDESPSALAVVSRGKLEHSDNYVKVVYTLNTPNYDRSQTGFAIVVSFT